jgi:hypothetical protein
MDREQVLTMDAYILLSIINMKLRDQFSSLRYFCEDYDIDESLIKDRLKTIDYVYNEASNQFVSI